jgi:hypothetical protein
MASEAFLDDAICVPVAEFPAGEMRMKQDIHLLRLGPSELRPTSLQRFNIGSDYPRATGHDSRTVVEK